MRFFHAVKIVFASFLLSQIQGTYALAEQVIHNLDQALESTLQNDLREHDNLVGQPFEASLTQAVRYRTWTLPEGTLFRGEVSREKPSKHFNRPGYVVLHVHEMEWPNGDSLSLSQYPDRNTKVYNPKSVTFGKNIYDQLPFTALNTTVSVALRTATYVSGAAVFPINVGARAAVGAVWGYYDPKNKNMPKPTRISYGINKGLGVITINRFLDKMPAPDFRTGDSIPIHLNAKALEHAFMQSDRHVQAEGNDTAKQSAHPQQPPFLIAAALPEKPLASSDDIVFDSTPTLHESTFLPLIEQSPVQTADDDPPPAVAAGIAHPSVGKIEILESPAQSTHGPSGTSDEQAPHRTTDDTATTVSQFIMTNETPMVKTP